MGNIFRFLLVLPCITLLLYSCESEIENEIQSSTEKLNLSGLESDSLQLESYELSEMTDELLESYPSHLALEVDIYHVLVGDRE